MELEWKDPPPGTTRRTGPPAFDYAGIIAALQGQPGRWARIFRKKSPAAGGKLKLLGAEIQFHTAGLGYPNGYCDTYARWPESSDTP